MLSIDRSCCDVEDVRAWQAIGLASRDVAHYRSEVTAYLNLARSWRMNPMAGRPGEAEAFAKKADAKAVAAASRMEGTALTVLNGTILEAGGRPGQVWEVRDWVYRVATPGSPCTCLGRDIPTDTPTVALDAIDSVFNDSWIVSDHDQLAEDMVGYAEMTHYNAR